MCAVAVGRVAGRLVQVERGLELFDEERVAPVGIRRRDLLLAGRYGGVRRRVVEEDR